MVKIEKANSQQPTANSQQPTANISKRIISLRFILIVFVVFIHNNPTALNFADGAEIYFIPVYVNIIRELISSIIARIAVPLFFIISGYLLYSKETRFIVVFKKKSRTILLPYLIWHILTILFYYVAQGFPFTKPYFTTALIREFGVSDWIGAFVGTFGIFQERTPLVYQFWFLRDLFILNLLFLPIKVIVDRLPFGTILLFFGLWISEINIHIISTEALFFFTLGYYVVKYSLECRKIDNIKIYDIAMLYFISIMVELFFYEKVPFIHKINIVIGGILFIKLSTYFISNQKIYNVLSGLEKYAFFVYAIHGTALFIMTKLSVRIMPMHGGWLLLQYFGVSTIGITIFVMIGVMIRNLSPELYAILTGGRIKNKAFGRIF